MTTAVRRHPPFLSRAILLSRKELRETLRDRRTIITLLAMPLLLYPLLGMAFRFMAVSQLKKAAGPDYLIAVATEMEAGWLQEALEIGERLVARRERQDIQVRTGNPTGRTPVEGKPRVRLVTPQNSAEFDLTAVVASSEADVGVALDLQDWIGKTSPHQKARVRLLSNADSAGSREALRYVQDRLQAANMAWLIDYARRSDPAIGVPVRVSQQSVASNQKSRGFLGVLPLVLLLMTVTGGVYPAIDLTAGERERDTLETLIALPVPRVHLLLAKFVAVFSVTLLTGLMNILAMTATVYTLRMETQLFGAGGLTLQLACALVLILTVFGLFYSAVLLALTSSSRSFKEAQAYLIPLMLLSIAPGLVILLPGWELKGLITVMPLVNMLLLARDVFEGTVQLAPAGLAVASTLTYATCALGVAAHLFGTDAIAVGSRGTWSDLLKRPVVRAVRPPLSLALMTLVLLFPLYFFATGLLSRTADTNPQRRLLISGVLTILLFGVFPLGVAVFRRLQLVPALQLRRITWRVWPSILLLGLGTWPWVYELVLLTQQLGIAQLDDERLQQVSEILERWRNVPLIVMVISLGVLPGVFEEFFFRGFLLSAFLGTWRKWPSILLCGFLFGVFHVIAAEGAAVERLLPSACLGCLLSWVAVRTGSVLPGMVLHVLHNSSLLVIAHYRDELNSLVVSGTQQEHLPVVWLAASALAVVSGVLWLVFATRDEYFVTVAESQQDPKS